jgi:hypothetical protein
MGMANTKFPRRGLPWTLAELKQLGHRPDSVLARRLGRPIKEVVAMRESRRMRLVTPVCCSSISVGYEGKQLLTGQF